MVLESRVVTSTDELHENRLKLRLIGAAVLIALAVIFLPLIFDGAGTESQFKSIESLEMEPPLDLEIFDERQVVELSESATAAFAGTTIKPKQIDGVVLGGTNNTPAESVEKVDMPVASETATPDPVDKAESALASALPKKTTPNITEKPKIQPSQSAVPVTDNSSWLIQTASFRDKINALSLRSELKGAGYPVDVKVGEKDGAPLFRVFVGPVIGKEKAEKIQAEIKKSLKRETLLVAE